MRFVLVDAPLCTLRFGIREVSGIVDELSVVKSPLRGNLLRKGVHVSIG